MWILGNMWRIWAQPSAIINTGKRVGISVDGLDADWMQWDKVACAECCMEKEENESTQHRNKFTTQCQKRNKRILQIQV